MSIRIALVGNPNCGKTTMFNALTGSSQYVGNWPGVTVEKKEGKLKGQKDVVITDLPGIYSLSPYTLEEVVSRDYLLKEKPDVIINLVDATNIERNLYLTTQVLEIGIPVVVALNMIDLLRKKGDRIDGKKLGRLLGCQVVETSALKGEGLQEAAWQAIALSKEGCRPTVKNIFSEEMEETLDEIGHYLPDRISGEQRRWYAIKVFEKDGKVLEELQLQENSRSAAFRLSASIENEKEDDAESIITNERYEYIAQVIQKTVKKSGKRLTASDKIDGIVTNRILGIPIFLLVMFFVYFISVTTVGTLVTDFTNDTLFGGWIQPAVAFALESIGISPVLESLVVDGIVGGLGAVLGFVPQMAILFLFLSLLEDCGYMVRIAFVMDRVFRHFGLSGKSFIPLLISSGCGVPGIMASKTIENENDRRLTIMTATFVPCGAKLPVIALIAGVMMGGAWWMAPLMYVMGVAAVLVSAIILKKTKPFSGEAAPFVMELPAYHIPSAKTVLLHVWERLKGFIIKAGTILFLACVVMWFLSSFGFQNGFRLVEDSSDSLLAAAGGFIAPVFAPLGFGSWKAVAASLSGFTAKESIVTTMAVLAGTSEEAGNLWDAVAVMFTGGLAAFSFLTFNMLDSPCLAAISTMAHELKDRKWFWFAILYQNLFAYGISLIIYQLGSWALTGIFGAGTAVAGVLLLFLLYMLFRRDPFKNRKLAGRRPKSLLT